MPGYISEVSWSNSGSPSFVEIAVPSGTDVSGYTLVVYSSNGRVDETYSLGTPNSTVAGQDVYTIQNVPTGSFPVVGTDAFALVDDAGNVLQFVAQSSGITATQGPADGLTATDIGQAPGGTSLQSDDGGATYYLQSAENPGTIPCYAPGTLIDTPDGRRAVESLQPGDVVWTLDNGPQKILWVKIEEVSLEEAEQDAKPILIATGALGPGVPVQDLIVSPQHRILVGGHQQLQERFRSVAFAPAKSLTSLKRIRTMKGKRRITWIHFACHRHEVVSANGCLSESLLLGPMLVNGLTAPERQVVTDIFGIVPTPDAALNGPPARECLAVSAVRRQLAKSPDAQEKLGTKEIRKWDLDLAMEQYEAELTREANAKTQSRVNSLA